VNVKFRSLFLIVTLALLVVGLAACSETAQTDKTPDASAMASYLAEPATNNGDATRGIQVFGRMPCLTCHTITGMNGGPPQAAAPTLDHIATNAATRLPGVTAAQYIRHAILKPEDLTIPEYHNVMPSFSTSLNQTDLNNLVAFLLTLK
jgi:mono/diheme cytochrome c family protein